MSKRKKPTKLSAAKQRKMQHERAMLCACLPEAWAGDWLEEFDYQNTGLIESGEEPLKHHEFLRCRLNDLATGGRGEMPW